MMSTVNISKCTRKEYTCFQHNNKEYWAEKVITPNGVVTDIYELPNYDDLQTLDNVESICQ